MHWNGAHGRKCNEIIIHNLILARARRYKIPFISFAGSKIYISFPPCYLRLRDK